MRKRINHLPIVHFLLLAALSCATFLLVASMAHAQTGGGTNTGGTNTGGTNTGGTNTGGTGSTQGTGFGTGGTGTTGTNFQGPTFMTVGESIDATGGTGFAGQGDVSQNFVGGGLQVSQVQGLVGGTRTTFGTQNQFGGQNQFSRQGQGQGQTGRGGFGRQPTGPSRAEQVRPRYRVAFTHSPLPVATVTNRLQTRISSLSSRMSDIAGVQVALDEQGNATLTGSVQSEDRARFAAALVRLEPGVRDVDNQLQIGGAN